MVSPCGFSLASFGCGAILPSLADLSNQYWALSILFIFGPQAPWAPDFSIRSMTESWALARASMACCGVLVPDAASEMLCHHRLARRPESGTLMPVGVHCFRAGLR